MMRRTILNFDRAVRSDGTGGNASIAKTAARVGDHKMTGKTHMAISAATVAVVLATAGFRASQGVPYLLTSHVASGRVINPDLPLSGAYSIAGLLLLGVVAGLFPDLDTPDAELQHLPLRAAGHLGRYVRVGIARRSLLQVVAGQLARLTLLPFSVALTAISTLLRAFTGHRGFTHTLWGAAVFTALVVGAALLITGDSRHALVVGVVWLTGYASHLAADACTPSGIPLFGRCIYALRSPWHQDQEPVPSAYDLGARNTHMIRSYGAAFHLLPRRMRIRTGGLADTLVIRWAGWAVCISAMVSMYISL